MSDTMLLVVGMQNDKYRPAVLSLDRQADPIVVTPHLLGKVNECIEAARARKWQVVFALDLHHPKHVAFQTQTPHCVLQTWGSEIVKGLHYGFDGCDMVLRGLDMDDDSNDAFYVSNSKAGAETPSQLRKLLKPTATAPIKRLCVCGASPDGCIEQTVNTASIKGFCRGDPIIISDCSALLAPTPPLLVFKPLSELLRLWGDATLGSPILDG
jgi:nicotinamidase-related amidase